MIRSWASDSEECDAILKGDALGMGRQPLLYYDEGAYQGV